jgi:ATP-dependent DNA ligase
LSPRPAKQAPAARGWIHEVKHDLLELDGEDLRRTPIEERKRILAKLVSHPHEGIAFNEHYTGDGAIIFKHACALGLRGIVFALAPQVPLSAAISPGGRPSLVLC